MAPTADCRFGDRCTRPECSFLHPKQQPSDAAPLGPMRWVVCGKFGERRCRNGASCANAQCGFAHPADWRFFYGTEASVAAPPPPASMLPPMPQVAAAAPAIPVALAPQAQLGGFGGGFAFGALPAAAPAFQPTPPPPPPAAQSILSSRPPNDAAHALAGALGERAPAAAAELAVMLADGRAAADLVRSGGMFDSWSLLHTASHAGNAAAVEALLAA
eukprot:5424454-Prymnesium_polylepis.1